MKKILMKDASGKVRLKSADRLKAYEAAGWIAVEDTPSKQTKTVVVDEPITLKMTDTMSEETQENNEEK